MEHVEPCACTACELERRRATLVGALVSDAQALTKLLEQMYAGTPSGPRYTALFTCPDCGRRWPGLVVGPGEPPRVKACWRCMKEAK